MTGPSIRRPIAATGLALAVMAAIASDGEANPYPTVAVGDYIFACMASNGETQDALKKCACSIDVIASILPYEAYTKAETVMSMRQVRGGGEKMALFSETAVAKDSVDQLKRAQIEAEIRCF